MNYEVIALSESLPGGRKAVEIVISSGSIIIKLADKEVNWPIGLVYLERGGAGNSFIYLKNDSDPNLTLYTKDKKILKDPNLSQNSSTQNSSKKLRASFATRKTLYITAALVIISIPVLFFVFQSTIVRKAADNVPIEWEVEAGQELFETLKGQYDIVEDSAISAKLDSLFAPLVEAANYDMDFKFYMCSDPTLNAFALPGGHVVINQGTLMKIERIEELYGVIGHELAHVTQRHHVRGLIGNLGTLIILQGVFGDGGTLGGILGESAGKLESLFYSREFERESDNVGFDYLTKAEIDPKGMVEFFQRIKETYEMGDDEYESNDTIHEPTDSTDQDLSESLEELTNFMSTHPGVDERINYLNERISKENVNFPARDFDLKKFQDFVQLKLN